jgi:hypothetical protein
MPDSLADFARGMKKYFDASRNDEVRKTENVAETKLCGFLFINKKLFWKN